MFSLPDFTETTFSHGGASRTVFRKGSGPGVVIMSEIPGITPNVAAFGKRVADEGFSVFMPDLFGTPGRPVSIPYVASSLLQVCVSREFSLLAARQASPITEWLRALCRYAHDEVGGKGVGAIGMCLTGNFALALMVEPVVMAPVLSQPSLPLAIGAELSEGLHVSDHDLNVIKRRVHDEEGLKVIGLRFNNDRACPKARFDHLTRELGDKFRRIEIDSSPGNGDHLPTSAHSVLTEDFADTQGRPRSSTQAALDEVLAFFRERLR
jgi:dienelactone hydrolase